MGAADAAGLGGVTSGGSTARPDRRFDDATALVAAVAAGELSPVEAMERALARMEEVNPALNAVVHPRAERALEEARGLSDAPAAGFAGRHRPLAGVPIAVKDLGCEQAGEPHHRGSRLLAEAGRREHEDSHLYGLLAGAGAVSLGRTNTPEFGTTITTEPAVYGPTANPWSL
ncbi:MAG TPA: hypothetical protein DEP69_03175, partial [Acidimicrobiaceae bacterium]|nr:hypothetical protein [Acidimicrobiaceae bacterium]